MINRTERDGVAILEMAHGKVSAIDLEFCAALSDAMDRTADCRAVVLTGRKSVFSAGVDLFRLLDGGVEYTRAFIPALDGVLEKIFTAPIPVVAAVNGHAIAGGCLVAAACDRRVMATGNGTVGVPELRVGVPFPPFCLELMRFLLSPQYFQEVVYRGATYSVQEALTRGLVDETTDREQVVDRAIVVALDYASIPPETFATAKAAIRAPLLRSVAALRESLGDRIESIWESDHTRGVIEAYLERTVGVRKK
jgi:enoyl-CoA hydratase